MTNIKNKVNVKYKTKNNITDVNPDFLVIKNQKKTKTSSRRNLRPTATRVCITFESGSRVCPLKKIARHVKTIPAKIMLASAASRFLNPMLKTEFNTNAAETVRAVRRIRRIEYFMRGLTGLTF